MKFWILLIMVLILSQSVAGGLSKVLMARVTIQNNVVEVDDILVSYGEVSKSDPDGNFIANLLNKELESEFQLRFSMERHFPTIPESIPLGQEEEFMESESDYYEALLFFPYFEGAEIIEIGYQGNPPIAFVGIKDEICNLNGECEENENFISCEADCSIEDDLYCYPEADEICDPDCVEGLDEDCGVDSVNPEEPGFNFQDYFIPIAIFLIVGLIIGYNLTKKK